MPAYVARAEALVGRLHDLLGGHGGSLLGAHGLSSPAREGRRGGGCGCAGGASRSAGRTLRPGSIPCTGQGGRGPALDLESRERRPEAVVDAHSVGHVIVAFSRSRRKSFGFANTSGSWFAAAKNSATHSPARIVCRPSHVAGGLPEQALRRPRQPQRLVEERVDQPAVLAERAAGSGCSSSASMTFAPKYMLVSLPATTSVMQNRTISPKSSFSPSARPAATRRQAPRPAPHRASASARV